MVLEHGEIKEIGTHQELLNLGGFYAGLELSQRNTGSSTPSRTLE
jgi:ABC-type multidrug transport system fused ATPase/permease subunit